LSMHGIQHGYAGRPCLLTTSDDDTIGFLPFYFTIRKKRLGVIYYQRRCRWNGCNGLCIDIDFT
jgi:hypothetical protein